MQCDKHPTYKGLQEPKRNCPDCLKLYRTVRARISGKNSQRKWGDKFVSISTPTHAYATQLLAEVSTFMLFGPQKPYFWRTGSPAAEHYLGMVKRLSAWRHRDRFIFDLFEQFMYHVYTQFKDQEVSNEVKFRQVVQLQSEEEDEEPDVEVTLDVVSEAARRKRSVMRKRREPDEVEEGQEERE